ncbi:MAG: hypothetical protein HY843_00275 [Bdellovibrio sp.]|nr:hypothetical protein [Bdellovibrio sp.]
MRIARRSIERELEFFFWSAGFIFGLIFALSLGGCKKAQKLSLLQQESTEYSKNVPAENVPDQKSIIPKHILENKITPKVELQNNLVSPASIHSVEKPIPLKKTCFILTFHHKPLASHSSDDACLEHNNLISLAHSQILDKSLCIKIDNVPVAHQIMPQKNKLRKNKVNNIEVLIGPVAGPNSVITAHYCLKGSICKEECKIPKDKFMESLGVAQDHFIQTKNVKWDASIHQEEGEAALGVDQDLEREMSLGEAQSIFSGWTLDKKDETCAQKGV